VIAIPPDDQALARKAGRHLYILERERDFWDLTNFYPRTPKAMWPRACGCVLKLSTQPHARGRIAGSTCHTSVATFLVLLVVPACAVGHDLEGDVRCTAPEHVTPFQLAPLRSVCKSVVRSSRVNRNSNVV